MDQPFVTFIISMFGVFGIVLGGVALCAREPSSAARRTAKGARAL